MEAKVAMQANHENIVRFFGMAKFKTGVGLVMEFMYNGSLLSLLRMKNNTLPWPFRVRVSSDIARGLAYLHKMVVAGKNIVHGDLKPENVLLDRYYNAKLADFGAATLSYVSQPSQNVQSNHAATLLYAAPEWLNYQCIRKPSGDVFSFGMTLYHIIFRTPPFSKLRCPAQLCLLFIKDNIENGIRPDHNIDQLGDLSATDKQYVQELGDMMKKCWVLDESERPDGLQVRDELSKMLQKIPEKNIDDAIADIKSRRPTAQPEDTAAWISLQDKLYNPSGKFSQQKIILHLFI